MKYIYHYYAFHQIGGYRHDMDGLITRMARVKPDHYPSIKEAIADYHGINSPAGLTIASLSLVGEEEGNGNDS